MATTTSIRSILDELNTYQNRIDHGDLRLEELDHLVHHTQELLERYIVLRFKAYEAMVSPDSTEHEHISSEQVEEIIHEEAIEHEQLQEDFDAMESEVAESFISDQPDVAFDLSLFDTATEEVVEVPLEEESVEHLSISSIAEEDEGIMEEKVVVEHLTQTPVADDNKAFIHQFSAIEPGFFGQIGMSRLDTLIGSFGLNERLQYINELFDGSSEAFSDAIKRLDQLSSYQDALIEASKFAHDYHWELDSDTVEELVTKLKRRHG
jgi:hypothetical protein